MYSPLYNIPLTNAHCGIGVLFDYLFQEAQISHSSQVISIESRMHRFLGLDQLIDSFDLEPQIDGSPAVLFKAFPFYEQRYQIKNFDRSEKICVCFGDGNTEEDGYIEELDHGLKYPLVFYSPKEFGAWMCITALAKLNFYPAHEQEMLSMIERNFYIDECLVLMHEKLTGIKRWDFGLEGSYAIQQVEWLNQASDPAANIAYIKWLAMAESVWARQFEWSQWSSRARRGQA
jgi:hypothetical protein